MLRHRTFARAGALPEAGNNGVRYLKLPVDRI
jgi:hypothetical protein